MTRPPVKSGFASRPGNPDSWVRAADAPTTGKSATEAFTARLTVDITPELRGRIKVAAFRHGITVADMLRDPDDLALFTRLSAVEATTPPIELPLRVVTPAFMISELRRAFEIGFLIFLPFLVIDLAVASILMAMGMMMLPPIVISMPFKVIFFVLVDGWNLVCGSLIKSFDLGPMDIPAGVATPVVTAP